MKKKEREQMKRLMKALAKNKKKKKKKKDKYPGLLPEYADWIHLDCYNPEYVKIPIGFGSGLGTYDFHPEAFSNFEDDLIKKVHALHEDFITILVKHMTITNSIFLIMHRLDKTNFIDIDIQPKDFLRKDGNIIVELRLVPMYEHDHGVSYKGTTVYNYDTGECVVTIENISVTIDCVF